MEGDLFLEKGGGAKGKGNAENAFQQNYDQTERSKPSVRGTEGISQENMMNLVLYDLLNINNNKNNQSYSK